MLCFVFFSVWFTSLNMIISRSIHVTANGFISFFLMVVNNANTNTWKYSLKGVDTPRKCQSVNIRGSKTLRKGFLYLVRDHMANEWHLHSCDPIIYIPLVLDTQLFTFVIIPQNIWESRELLWWFASEFFRRILILNYVFVSAFN